MFVLLNYNNLSKLTSFNVFKDIPAIIDTTIDIGSPIVLIDNPATTCGKYCGFVAKNTILELQNTASETFHFIE